MKFEPGKSGNPSGRPPGSKNRTSEQLRNLFRDFLFENVNQLQSDFDKLKPRERLAFIEKLARLIVPPPFSPEALSEQQLEQVINHLKKKQNEQISQN